MDETENRWLPRVLHRFWPTLYCHFYGHDPWTNWSKIVEDGKPEGRVKCLTCGKFLGYRSPTAI